MSGMRYKKKTSVIGFACVIVCENAKKNVLSIASLFAVSCTLSL